MVVVEFWCESFLAWRQGWWNVALNTRGVGGSTGSATWTGTDEREDIVAACSQLVNEVCLCHRGLMLAFDMGQLRY